MNKLKIFRLIVNASLIVACVLSLTFGWKKDPFSNFVNITLALWCVYDLLETIKSKKAS